MIRPPMTISTAKVNSFSSRSMFRNQSNTVCPAITLHYELGQKRGFDILISGKKLNV
jgi:hypothetical protein